MEKEKGKLNEDGRAHNEKERKKAREKKKGKNKSLKNGITVCGWKKSQNTACFLSSDIIIHQMGTKYTTSTLRQLPRAIKGGGISEVLLLIYL